MSEGSGMKLMRHNDSPPPPTPPPPPPSSRESFARDSESTLLGETGFMPKIVDKRGLKAII